MASNLDREILSARKCINLVFIRVSGVFRSSTSFPCLEGFSAPLGARKCLSPAIQLTLRMQAIPLGGQVKAKIGVGHGWQGVKGAIA